MYQMEGRLGQTRRFLTATAVSLLLLTEAMQPSGFFPKKKPPCTLPRC